MNNIFILEETLGIMKAGGYWIDGEKVALRLSEEQFTNAIYLPVEKVRALCDQPEEKEKSGNGACEYRVENEDSFLAASKMAEHPEPQRNADKVLVLNFANPIHPGGGVRRGARAQEEELCRKSTLLASLESKKARPFYQVHRAANSHLASDAMILSPDVEVIRDENNGLLKETMVVSVITCAAPMINRGMQITREDLDRLLYDRIMGILHVAASYGYEKLVLGAWGCGAFGNDARQMAEIFERAFRNLRCAQQPERECFRQITFAVLDRSQSQYNYRSFQEYFGNKGLQTEEPAL